MTEYKMPLLYSDAALAVHADSQFRYRKAVSDVAEMRHIH